MKIDLKLIMSLAVVIGVPYLFYRIDKQTKIKQEQDKIENYSIEGI